MPEELKVGLATSCHNLRYFLFGGYLVFLVKTLEMHAEGRTETIAWLGLSVTLLCLVMDLRNYVKYRQLTTPEKQEWYPGIVTILLTAFYLGWMIWFNGQIGESLGSRRGEPAEAGSTTGRGWEVPVIDFPEAGSTTGGGIQVPLD